MGSLTYHFGGFFLSPNGRRICCQYAAVYRKRKLIAQHTARYRRHVLFTLCACVASPPVGVTLHHAGSVDCRSRVCSVGPGHLCPDGGSGSGGHSGCLLVLGDPVKGEYCGSSSLALQTCTTLQLFPRDLCFPFVCLHSSSLLKPSPRLPRSQRGGRSHLPMNSECTPHWLLVTMVTSAPDLAREEHVSPEERLPTNSAE